MIKVLGVDGSLTRSGLAVVETAMVPGRERVLATGSKSTCPDDGTDNARCTAIARACVALARRYHVDLVGLETPYVDAAVNIRVALRLEGLRSTLEGAMKNAGFEVVSVQASSAKKALGTSGRPVSREDGKRAVHDAVLLRFGLDLGEDEADAVGVALAAVVKQRKVEREGVQLALGIKRGPRRKRGQLT